MTRRPVPDAERGMILVNVLMFVAIASALVLLMVNREELALDRALRMREAARAMAVARGGELSAVTALAQDQVTAPESDHRGEPWAQIEDRGAAIDGGTFDLAIADAQGRFNVNLLRSGETAPVLMFRGLAREVGMDDDQVVQAIAWVRTFGPVTDLRPIRLAGVPAATADRLALLVTALPGNTDINLNAAGVEMLTFLFRDRAVAERLIAVRDRQGFLVPKDLADAGVNQPGGTGFRSDTFWVRSRVRIGATTQQVASLIQRRRNPDGTRETVPVARWINAAVPPDAPAL